MRKKYPLVALDASDVIPLEYRGIQTDVIEVGDIVAQAYDQWARPTLPGDSIGHFNITAGTFGCMVRRKGTNDPFMLSNNHVFADTNKANIGDPILQPGPHDGGTADDLIGYLKDFVPIEFSTDAPTCPIATGIAKVLSANSPRGCVAGEGEGVLAIAFGPYPQDVVILLGFHTVSCLSIPW